VGGDREAWMTGGGSKRRPHSSRKVLGLGKKTADPSAPVGMTKVNLVRTLRFVVERG
jgi:hypothetical protein